MKRTFARFIPVIYKKFLQTYTLSHPSPDRTASFQSLLAPVSLACQGYRSNCTLSLNILHIDVRSPRRMKSIRLPCQSEHGSGPHVHIVLPIGTSA